MGLLKKFTLPKTGEAAVLEILGPQHLADVLDLQDRTREALPDAQKMFVLPQSPAYFEALLAKQGGLMIGVSAEGKLLSQMVVMGPLTLDEVVEKQKLTRNDVTFHHAGQVDQIVMAKSMAVCPGNRGNELSQQMLAAMLDLPMVRAADHVFAQISADNVRSWELFLRHGFGIVAAAIDPNDKKTRFVVQRPVLGFGFHHERSAEGIDPAADFAAIMRLTQREALIGLLDEGEAFKLAFYASVEKAAAWGGDMLTASTDVAS